jgi:hypothetical protein
VNPPSPERIDPEREFIKQIHVVLRTLDRTLVDLMDNFWEEPLRRHAHEMASTLLEGCKTYGYLELASVTRALVSLLALRLEDVLTLQDALREKFKELMGLMREMALLLVA